MHPQDTRLALLHCLSLLRALDKHDLDNVRELVEEDYSRGEALPWKGVTDDALQNTLQLVEQALDLS